MAIREYLRPKSVEEAWSVLGARRQAAIPIGGGIDARLFGAAGLSTLVDLCDVGLSYVRAEEGVAIGATTTFTEILESAAARDYADGILLEVLQRVASPLQRNLGTIGGTLGSAHPWSDVIPLLLVLDAEIVVYDGRSRSEGLADYLVSRAAGERPLITEVRLPRPAAPSGCAFEKYASTGFDVAILNCACSVAVEEGGCCAARIAVGGTPGLAKRLPAAERLLEGSSWEASAIAQAAALASDAIDARDDRRASAVYRRDLARVGVARCLERIAERLEGKR
jgi:aerobic carbon-monoxide dehydrogenase medium subunit